MSFIGLSGLESGMLPSNPALCDLSNAICCCCCAPPRRYPGSCRTHHHHPSPGHSQTSISSLLTRPLAVCASFVPSPCALCAGLMRRLKRPLRPQGRLTGRREERRRRPQRARRRRRRFGRSDGRWRQCARPFGCLVRPSEAAAEQQQQQQQRRLWASKGAGGGSHVGAEAYAAGEPPEPPGGVAGPRREGSQRSLTRLCPLSVPSVQALYSGLSDRCGHQSSCQDGGSSGYDGRSVRAGGGGGLAARAGGGGRACTRSGVSGSRQKQQRSSSSSSSRGGYSCRRAPTAAWEAAARRTQSGRRWSRPEASQGRVGRVPGGQRSLNQWQQSNEKKVLCCGQCFS